MPTECPITSCQVLDKTCTTEQEEVYYDNSGNKKNNDVFAQDAEKLWAIQSNVMPTNKGFTSDVCYKCSNRDSSKTFVIENLMQVNTCVHSFEKKMKVVTDPETNETTTTNEQ